MSKCIMGAVDVLDESVAELAGTDRYREPAGALHARVQGRGAPGGDGLPHRDGRPETLHQSQAGGVLRRARAVVGRIRRGGRPEGAHHAPGVAEGAQGSLPGDLGAHPHRREREGGLRQGRLEEPSAQDDRRRGHHETPGSEDVPRRARGADTRGVFRRGAAAEIGVGMTNGPFREGREQGRGQAGVPGSFDSPAITKGTGPLVTWVKARHGVWAVPAVSPD